MSRGRLLTSLCSMVFLVNLARVVYAPLVEPLRAAFEVGPGTIGLVVTLVWVGSALPRIPTGYLLTLVPRHRVVLLTGCVLTVASLFAALADSLISLAAGAVLMGLASGAYYVSANPLVSELYPNRVGRAMGVHGTASAVAAVLAAPFVTVALLGWTWRAVFATIGLAAFVATIVFYAIGRDAELPQASGVDRDFVGAIRSQWRLILLGIAILGTTGFVWQGVFNFYASYLEATRGLSGGAARNLLTVIFAAAVPAFWVSGRLFDRLPSVPYIATILSAFVACLLALTASHGLPALIVVSAVMGYVIHSLFPALDAFLLSSLPDESRGGAYAVYSGAMMLVQATGSWAVGSLVEYGVAYDTVFRMFAFAVVGVVALLLALHATDRVPDGAPAGVRT